MPGLFLLGRVLFGGFFVFNGIHHLVDTATLASFTASKGMPMAEAAVIGTGVLLLIGGFSVLLGVWPRIGILCIAL
jgi:putative oxidoreductase